MLPGPVPAPGPDLVACRRLLIRCAGVLSVEGRRLRSLDLSHAVAGPCAAALDTAACALAAELRSVGDEIERQADQLRRVPRT